VIDFKLQLLGKTLTAFDENAQPKHRETFEAFVGGHAWLADFGLFMALKRAHDSTAWNT
jgi:4-alpha-glucanotransferase